MKHAREQHGPAASLNRTAFAATWHCLTGCAIGEILGLVIATALGWSNVPSIAIAVVLAFFFGYALTLRPLIAAGCRSVRQRELRSPPTPPRSL